VSARTILTEDNSIRRTFAYNKVAKANESVSGDVIRSKAFARTSPHPDRSSFYFSLWNVIK